MIFFNVQFIKNLTTAVSGSAINLLFVDVKLLKINVWELETVTSTLFQKLRSSVEGIAITMFELNVYCKTCLDNKT